MTRTKLIKTCVDRVLVGDRLIEAASRAVEENPANVPILPMGTEGFAAPLPMEMALETRTLWQPGRVLRVRFLDGHPTVQAKVEAVAHQWSQYANIKFVFGDDPDAEIRISFSADSGSWSYLGTDALGIPMNQPTMNFGWLQLNTHNVEYNRVVLHEFGHALGCIHEHQHPHHGIPWNKEAVYRAYAGPPNHWSKELVDRNLFQKYSVDQTQFSDFDTMSIMLYPISKELTDGSFEVGWNSELSQTDKTFIGTIYPPEPVPVIDLSVGALPTEADIGDHGEEDLFHFVVTRPGTYTIETGGPTDVVMGLYGPNNRTEQIAHDEDSGQDQNAKITKVLQLGSYYIRIRHQHPTGVGKYTVVVSSRS